MEDIRLDSFRPGIKLVDAWEWREKRKQRHDEDPRVYERPFIRTTPLDWITSAARLPGKCLHVAQALWYISGLRKTRTVKISSKILGLFGVSRHAYSRCLSAMERAGLVKVERRLGKTPLVTILEVGEHSHDAAGNRSRLDLRHCLY